MAAQFGNVPDAQGGRRPPQQARKLRPGPFTWSDDSEEGKNRLPLVTSSMIRKESAPRSREASEERHTSVQRNQRSVPGSAAANSSELWDSSGWPGYLSGQDTDHNLRPLFDDSLDDVTSNEDTLFIREVRYGDDRPQPVTGQLFAKT